MNLIIQGLEIENRDLRELAKLAGANDIEQITGQAFRLKNANRRDQVPEYCADAGLDFAFVEQTVQSGRFWPGCDGYGFHSACDRVH